MKSTIRNKIPLLFCSGLVATTPLSISSCGESSIIQLANFESYMDDDLMDHLTNKYDVEYQWFTVDEMIETKFKKVYDIAVPSGYELVSLYKKGWLHKIQWSKFGIPGVESKEDAKTLFVTDGIEQMNNIFRQYDGIPSDFDVLDYGVPYFGQSFTFAYKGTPLTFYKDGTTQETEQPTWADIFYTISPSNPKLDPRFNQTVTGRTGMLDDAKSLYDVSRIMETTKDNPFEATNQMPKDASIPDLVNTYKVLTDKFADKKGSWFALNTDSGIISRNLADHKHGYEAALTWSGDALYAAMGAEEFEEYTGEQLHIQKPYGTSLDEIEFLVINNKNDKNKSKLDRIYKVLYDVCLDACQVSADELLDEENDHYKYWSMQNWNQVMYMPMLRSIYDCVTDPEYEYWQESGRSESSKQLFTYILTETNPEWASSVFGRTLTALENSNTHWAWLQSRGKL